MSTTLKTLLCGFLGAVLLNIPIYSWAFVKGWAWAVGFPLGWLGRGLLMVGTLFHEIGHSVTGWFYGFPGLPMFDLRHGGGVAVWYNSGHDLIILIAAVYAVLACALYYFRDVIWVRNLLIGVIIFNALTIWSETIKYNMMDFMGPAAECLIAGALLCHALFYWKPRVRVGRFISALIGFALILSVWIESLALLNNGTYRLIYYQQKGREGWGDFDKIARRTEGFSFETIVYLWGGLGFLCLVIPIIFYVVYSQKNLENHNI